MNWIKSNKGKTIAIVIIILTIVCVAIANHCDHENVSHITDKVTTCISKGQYHNVCKDCGKWLDNDNKVVSEGTYYEFETYGDHNFINPKVTKEPTCGDSGVKTYTCGFCNKTKTETIPATKDHTEGEWIITQEATYNVKSLIAWDYEIEKIPGVKTLKCSVCGDTIKTENFDLTDEQVAADYKSKCSSISYRELETYPNDYDETPIVISGTVLQVSGNLIRVNVGGGNVIGIRNYDANEFGKIYEGNSITAYGEFRGLYTYESVAGWNITIPSMSIVIKG